MDQLSKFLKYRFYSKNKRRDIWLFDVLNTKEKHIFEQKWHVIPGSDYYKAMYLDPEFSLNYRLLINELLK